MVSATFDNLFTSFFLLDELSKRGIGVQVTIKQNRLENAAVPSKQRQKLKKVPCFSNYSCAASEKFIKRWSKAEKKTNELMAHPLMLCKKIGLVDLFDQFVATIRSKK